MDIGDGGAVLVKHHGGVVHAHHLLLHGQDHGGVPEDQEPILTAHNDLTLMDRGAQHLRKQCSICVFSDWNYLGFMLETLHTLG